MLPQKIVTIIFLVFSLKKKKIWSGTVQVQVSNKWPKINSFKKQTRILFFMKSTLLRSLFLFIKIRIDIFF